MTLSKLQRVLAGLALMLIFISGCSSAPVPTSIPHTSTPHFAPDDNPTTGAMARSTRQAQATVTRQAMLNEEATQTAEAQVDATATVVARATAQAIVAAKADWPSLIRESFSDNQLGWPLGLTQDHSLAVTSTITTGRYHWVVNVMNGNSYFNLIPTNGPSLDKFQAAVNVQFVQGNDDGQSAYGLTFRHVEDDYGFFGILKSGRFLALEVHHTGIYQSIGESSPAIDTRPGHPNRLEVVGIGSDFVFLINGQPVAQLTADIDPGQIGHPINVGLTNNDFRYCQELKHHFGRDFRLRLLIAHAKRRQQCASVIQDAVAGRNRNGFFSRGGWIQDAPYPLNRWTSVRPLPAFNAHFRPWWQARLNGSKEKPK